MTRDFATLGSLPSRRWCRACYSIDKLRYTYRIGLHKKARVTDDPGLDLALQFI
ncbi:MAG: Uncharacterised protein [Halieaceae bacterium]|nr:MAG: Uncharacterised protein [Halieaceae bacterium]